MYFPLYLYLPSFQFIKSLQGVHLRLVKSYLQEAEKDVTRLWKVRENIEKEKKRALIKKIFLQQTDCSTWDDALEWFPDHIERLDEFLGNNFNL